MPRINREELFKYLQDCVDDGFFSPDAPARGSELAAAGERDIADDTAFISDRLDDLSVAEGEIVVDLWDKKFIKRDTTAVTVKSRKDSLCSIAVVAPVSAGKSTLLNALCEYPILPAASTVTSCTPTYITRSASFEDESITVYPLIKMSFKNNNTEFFRFVRDDKSKITFHHNDISPNVFDKLLKYVIYIMKGNGSEYLTTIENIAYFMASEESAVVEYFGYDSAKLAVPDGEFALNYQDPRHRFVLLMVLLGLYVDQNSNQANMTPYKRKINQMRNELMGELGLPVSKDYCVYLDWYSGSIPKGATLIDLPGTGSDTQDQEGQSSHTALVKGILEGADALWVLCSDNGTVQEDLLTAIKDEVESNTDKSKVCIYNFKNNGGSKNDSQPVKSFIDRLPFLAGERCYVVNALAGEYRYIVNGISIRNTKQYAHNLSNIGEPLGLEALRKRFEDPMFMPANYPTYTSVIENGIVKVTQDSRRTYTLSSFFKKALNDYVARLKYEVVVKDGLRQGNFFLQVSSELLSSYKLLASLVGKDDKIADAVRSALDVTFNKVCDDLAIVGHKKQVEMSEKLGSMAEKIGESIKKAFADDYKNLISSLHSAWHQLITPKTKYTLESNFLGNYIIKSGSENEKKIDRIRNNARSMITVTAFKKAIEVVENGLNEYRAHLQTVIVSLKKIVYDFAGGYANCFFNEYDSQRDKVCYENGVLIHEKLYNEFDSTKKELEDVIEEKMNVLYESVCKSFDWLLDENGEFEELVKAANKQFRAMLSDWILDKLRNDITERYNCIRRRRIILNDVIDKRVLLVLLNDNFSALEKRCKSDLEYAVNGIYGINLNQDEEIVNFPNKASSLMNKLVSGISTGEEGAFAQIENTHILICDLIDSATKRMMDVQGQLEEIENYMKEWNKFGKAYCLLVEFMYESANKTLYDEYLKLVDSIKIE